MTEIIIELEIVEARDLLASDSNGFSDPYVVIDKTPGMISASSKTPVIKKTLNPVWNYSTVLHFRPDFGKIKFRVFDWDRFSSDDPLGSCSIPASMLMDGVPLDIWQPLEQKPAKKSKDKKGPWPTKGELHLKLSAKLNGAPAATAAVPAAASVCAAGAGPSGGVVCDCGNWYALQSGSGPGQTAQIVQADSVEAGSFDPFLTEVSLGLGWDFAAGQTLDLDASVIALDAESKKVDVIYYGNSTGCGGAVRHSGDNRTGAGEGDDEVIHLDLTRMPPNVARLVCVVNCYSQKSLSLAQRAYVRLFTKQQTLGSLTLTSICDSVGLIFCFLQRSSAGTWFFQTVAQPVEGNWALSSLPHVCEYFAAIPLF